MDVEEHAPFVPSATTSRTDRRDAATRDVDMSSADTTTATPTATLSADVEAANTEERCGKDAEERVKQLALQLLSNSETDSKNSRGALSVACRSDTELIDPRDIYSVLSAKHDECIRKQYRSEYAGVLPDTDQDIEFSWDAFLPLIEHNKFRVVRYEACRTPYLCVVSETDADYHNIRRAVLTSRIPGDHIFVCADRFITIKSYIAGHAESFHMSVYTYCRHCLASYPCASHMCTSPSLSSSFVCGAGAPRFITTFSLSRLRQLSFRIDKPQVHDFWARVRYRQSHARMSAVLLESPEAKSCFAETAAASVDALDPVDLLFYDADGALRHVRFRCDTEDKPAIVGILVRERTKNANAAEKLRCNNTDRCVSQMLLDMRTVFVGARTYPQCPDVTMDEKTGENADPKPTELTVECKRLCDTRIRELTKSFALEKLPDMQYAFLSKLHSSDRADLRQCPHLVYLVGWADRRVIVLGGSCITRDNRVHPGYVEYVSQQVAKSMRM